MDTHWAMQMAGRAFFGFDTSVPPYPGAPFTQSVAVYINVNTPAGSDPASPAFWVDMSPSSSSPSDAGLGGIGYGGEHNFRLSYTGTAVAVTADGATPLATLTTSGWYTFRMTYSKGATGTDLAMTTLDIYDASGNPVGVSTTEPDNSDSDPLESQYLQGPGYVWLTVWQNNFSSDYLAIDNVCAETAGGDCLGMAATAAPEPVTFALFGSGLLLAGAFTKLRRGRAK